MCFKIWKMLHNFHKHLVSIDPVCSRDKITMVVTEEYELDSHLYDYIRCPKIMKCSCIAATPSCAGLEAGNLNLRTLMANQF